MITSLLECIDWEGRSSVALASRLICRESMDAQEHRDIRIIGIWTFCDGFTDFQCCTACMTRTSFVTG